MTVQTTNPIQITRPDVRRALRRFGAWIARRATDTAILDMSPPDRTRPDIGLGRARVDPRDAAHRRMSETSLR